MKNVFIIPIAKPFEKVLPHLRIFLPLLFVGLSIYFLSLHAPFQMDDDVHIVQNTAIKHLLEIRNIWNYDPFRFITNLTLAVNHACFGLNVTGYHVTNLLIHILNSFLVFQFAGLIFKTPQAGHHLSERQITQIAFFASLIFLVHPIQTQAVTYTVQRATSLAALFYLITMNGYLKFRLLNSRRHYGLALAASFLSVFTKQTVVTFPFALMLIEFFLLAQDFKSAKKSLYYIAPFFLTVLLIPWMYVNRFNLTSIGHLINLTKESAKISRLHYLFTQFRVWVTYLRLLVIPIHQNFDYDYPLYTHFFYPEVLASFLLSFSILLAAARISKRYRIISFGIFFFYLSFLPDSSVFPLSDVIAEHRLYLPMISFSVVFAASIFWVIKNEKIRRNISILTVIVFGLLTCARNWIWSDSIRLMEDVVRKSPNKARPHNNLGNFYWRNHEDKKAEAEFQSAIQHGPKYFEAYQNLGALYYSKGRLEEAVQLFNQAIALRSDFATPHIYLGHIDYSRQDYKKAELEYRTALHIDPRMASAFSGLASIDMVRKNWVHALIWAKQAVYVNPDSSVAHYILGNLYYATNRLHEAASVYQKAVHLEPSLVPARNNLGSAYFALGNYLEAAAQFHQILESDPQSESAYFNLANVYHELGDLRKAEEYLREAARIAKEKNNVRLLEKISKRQVKTVDTFEKEMIWNHGN